MMGQIDLIGGVNKNVLVHPWMERVVIKMFFKMVNIVSKFFGVLTSVCSRMAMHQKTCSQFSSTKGSDSDSCIS